MPDRQVKIGPNTVGSLPCEVSLNKILTEHPTFVRKVMSRYNQYKNGIKEIEAMRDSKLYETVLKMWKERNDNVINSWQNVPKDIHSHLLCCVTAQFRIAIKAS